MTKRTIVLLTVLLLLVISMGCQNTPQKDNPKAQVSMTKGIPILMYHKVNSDRSVGGLGLRVPEKDFRWQLKYLYDHGYRTITMQELIDYWDKGKKLPDKPVVITFDDGYRDNLTKAYPILKKYNFTATIFIATDYVGNINNWDIPNGQPPNTMLTWDEILSLRDKGIDIEAHTMSHPHLANISHTEMVKEITGSKELLEEKLGRKVRFLAYPYGNHNQAVEEAVRQAGYLAAVVTDPQGKVDAQSNRYALKRVRIMGHYDNQTFVNVLYNPEKGYELYKKTVEKK